MSSSLHSLHTLAVGVLAALLGSAITPTAALAGEPVPAAGSPAVSLASSSARESTWGS